MGKVGLTREQKVVISIARSLAKRLVAEHPEISEIYITPYHIRQTLHGPDPDVEGHLGGMTGRWEGDIADKFLSDSNATTREVRKRAVRYALAELIAAEERERELNYRLTLGGHLFVRHLESKYRDLDPEEIARRKRTYWDSLSVDEKQARIRDLVTKRGESVWRDEEVAYLLDLMEDPKYQHKGGRQDGRPNLNRIMEELDRKYGRGTSPSRLLQTAVSAGYVPQKRPPRIDPDGEGAYILRLCQDLEFCHDKGWYAGLPNLQLITDKVNETWSFGRSKGTIRDYYNRHKNS